MMRLHKMKYLSLFKRSPNDMVKFVSAKSDCFIVRAFEVLVLPICAEEICESLRPEWPVDILVDLGSTS